MILIVEFYNGILIIVGIIILIILIYTFSVVRNKQINKRVIKHSEYIKGLSQINDKYKPLFHNHVSSNTMTIRLNSKRQFDKFNYNKYGCSYILQNSTVYAKVIEKLESNRKLLAEYRDEIKLLKYTNDPMVAKLCRIKLNDLIKREIKLSSKFILHPVTNYSLIIEWQYISPAGRNFYSDSRIFDLDFIKQLLFNQEESLHNEYYSPNFKSNKSGKNNGETYSLDDIDDVVD